MTSVRRACAVPRRGWSAAIPLLLTLAGSLAFAALGPRYGGTLRIGVVALPATLEPSLAESLGARGVSALIHETLVGVGPEGLPTPGLVASWTSSAGGREWTLSLHPGARFHDERPVTADDAVRSLRRFLRSPSRAAEWLALGLEGGMAFRDKRSTALPGVASLDAGRLVLRFPEPQALPLAPLASPLAAVTSATGQGCGPFVPTRAATGASGAAPTGATKLRGAAGFTPAEERGGSGGGGAAPPSSTTTLSLNAFAGHVRGRPYLDQIDVYALPDSATLRTELAGGRIEAAFDAALDTHAPGTSGWAGAASESGTPAAVLLLVLDATHAPFERPETRAAAVAALDRAALVRPFIPGGEVWSALLPAALLASLPAPPALPPVEPSAARLMLAIANDVAPTISQRVVALLSEGGFDVRLAARRTAGARRVPPDARLLLFVPEVAEAGLALHELAALGLASPEAEQDLAAARLETGLDRRRAWLLAAEQALRADGTRVALAALPLRVAGAAKLHGLRLDAAGRLLAEDAWRAP